MKAEAEGSCGSPHAPGGAGWADDGGCDGEIGVAASQALKLTDTSNTMLVKKILSKFNFNECLVFEKFY